MKKNYTHKQYMHNNFIKSKTARPIFPKRSNEGSADQFHKENTNIYDMSSDEIKPLLNLKNPIQLLMEFSHIMGWPQPEIDTNPKKLEIPTFKSLISVNIFQAEAANKNKKISRLNAARSILEMMLEDSNVGVRLKKFLLKINEEMMKKNKRRREESFDEGIKFEERKMRHGHCEEFISIWDHCSLHISFQSIMQETIKVDISIGSQLMGSGVDKSLTKACSFALEKSVEQVNNLIQTDLSTSQSLNKHKEEHPLFKYNVQIEELNKLFNPDINLLKINFELFCLKIERQMVAPHKYREEIVSVIDHNIKNHIYENVQGPFLCGSFQYECESMKHQVTDLFYSHTITSENFEVFIDILCHNISTIQADNLNNSILPFRCSVHKLSELNYDVHATIYNKDFKILIREYNASKDLIEYLLNIHQSHTSLMKNQTEFTILQRLLRNWRRNFSLNFLLPETLDWMIIFYTSGISVTDTLAKIFYKTKKFGREVFNNNNSSKFSNPSLPRVIQQNINEITDDEISRWKKAAEQSLISISQSDFTKIFIC